MRGCGSEPAQNLPCCPQGILALTAGACTLQTRHLHPLPVPPHSLLCSTLKTCTKTPPLPAQLGSPALVLLGTGTGTATISQQLSLQCLAELIPGSPVPAPGPPAPATPPLATLLAGGHAGREPAWVTVTPLCESLFPSPSAGQGWHSLSLTAGFGGRLAAWGMPLGCQQVHHLHHCHYGVPWALTEDEHTEETTDSCLLLKSGGSKPQPSAPLCRGSRTCQAGLRGNSFWCRSSPSPGTAGSELQGFCSKASLRPSPRACCSSAVTGANPLPTASHRSLPQQGLWREQRPGGASPIPSSSWELPLGCAASPTCGAPAPCFSHG